MAHREQGGWYVSPGPDGQPAIAWWMVLVLPWLVNFIAQSLEDYVLNPLIQGKATELHPVVIMLAVLAGGSLAGLYGMLLAVPVAACLKILLSAEVLPRLRQWAGAEGDGTRA
jgi:predicted PurR-regulated permease PerM